jgi:hypothetical protein
VVFCGACLALVNDDGVGVVGGFDLPKVTKSHYLLTINYLEEFTLDDNASKRREFRRARVLLLVFWRLWASGIL